MANGMNLGVPVKAAVGALIGVLIIGAIPLGTTTLFDVDTESEWSSNEASQSNTAYTDGYLQFADGTATTASYTSNEFTFNQSGDVADRVQVTVDDIESANSVDVTVTGYDDSSSQTDTTTVTLEEGSNNVDVSGFADTTETVDVSFDLSRDAGDDTSPKVNAFVGESVDDDSIAQFKPLFQLMVIAGAALVVVRTMM